MCVCDVVVVWLILLFGLLVVFVCVVAGCMNVCDCWIVGMCLFCYVFADWKQDRCIERNIERSCFDAFFVGAFNVLFLLVALLFGLLVVFFVFVGWCFVLFFASNE